MTEGTRILQKRHAAASSTWTSFLTIMVCFVFMLVCMVQVVEASFTIVLGSGDEQCFTVRTPKNTPALISGNYDLLDDELNPDPISITLHDDTSGRELWQADTSLSEEVFALEVNTNVETQGSSSRFSICFLHYGMGGGDDIFEDFYGEGEEGEYGGFSGDFSGDDAGYTGTASRSGSGSGSGSIDLETDDAPSGSGGMEEQRRRLQEVPKSQKVHHHPKSSKQHPPENYKNPDDAPRTIGFNLRVTSLDNANINLDFNPEEATAIVAKAVKLVEEFSSLSDHQAYMRSRNAQHKDLVEATFRRIVNWSLLEAVVLIGVASGQVLYLQKFFETKIYL